MSGAPLVRLADRIRAEADAKLFDPLSFHPSMIGSQHFGGHNDLLRLQFEHIRDALIKGAPCITGDNVAEFFYNGKPNDKTGWDIRVDFPALIPPFPDFWVEWCAPSLRDQDVRAMRFPKFTGGIVNVRAADEPPGTGWGTVIPDHEYDELRPGARWVWTVLPVMRVEDDFAMPHGCFIFSTTTEGEVIESNVISGFGDRYQQLLVDASYDCYLPLLMTLTFLNLKNAALTEPASYVPPKFAKSYERRHGVPLVRIRTVVVDPNRVTKPDLPGPPTSRVMPVHLVRGHIVRYGGENGLLFGKYAGVFMRPPHVRGDRTAGISLHDYAVKPTVE